jgi:hypothetical protein
MRSSSLFAVVALLLLRPSTAHAQQAQGFNFERFYPSGAGAGWFVMDDLDIHGKVGGAMGLSLAYEHDPLVLSDGTNRVAVVTDRAYANFGAGFTYDRFRLHLDFDLPAVIDGQSGTLRGYQFTGPNVDPTTLPDPISDIRLGYDVRVVGDSHGPFRFGLGMQVFYPSGRQPDYDTDNTFRAMFRALFAGNVHAFTYAAHVGMHLRLRDDRPAPGGPMGPELLFGVAMGPRIDLTRAHDWALIVGPEVFGATALRSFFGPNATALEGLLTARLEGTHDEKMQVRLKVGTGFGSGTFGAPEWRIIAGIEIFNHNHIGPD